MPRVGGGLIDGTTEFNLIELHIDRTYDWFIGHIQVYQVDGETETWVGNLNDDRGLWEGSEVEEVLGRIAAGTCQKVYRVRTDSPERAYRVSEEELKHHLWTMVAIHPFHSPHQDPHAFFEHLTEGANFLPAVDRMPARFEFPGIVEGVNRRYYKRQDNAVAPDVRAVADLGGAGWGIGIPYGPYELHAVDILETSDGVSVGKAQEVYFRRKDVDGAIRAIARQWHEYWTGLTSSEQGINTRMTMREHVEHAIGRAWAARPFGSDIRVFYEGNSGALTRNARFVEDWYLGNLEQWAHQWGFAAFALALNSGGNRATLQSQLDDYTFCLVNEDGSLGDRLANPNEGILESVWTAWGTTDYNAALGTVISVATGIDKDADSGSNQVLVSTVTVVNPVGATVYQWEQESGPEQTLTDSDAAHATFQAPTLEAGDDPVVLVFKVTATNNGESASDTITVTVNPPASE